MKYTSLPIKSISANLFVFGTTHAAIDAICAGIIFSILKKQVFDINTFGVLVITYNFLAFGSQPFFGYICDILRCPRCMALVGCILTAFSAILFQLSPITSIVLAGIGNAMFHIGGGSICLNLIPQKASAPGIFVAPGAFGLMIGTFLGNNGQFNALPFVLVLILLGISMLLIKKTGINYESKIKESANSVSFEVILILMLTSIAIRSMIGMVMVFTWKSNFDLLIILTLAVVLGKTFGGILADKLGWTKVAVGSLLLSIPFLSLASGVPALVITGIFLFNLSMPVTLLVVSNTLQGKPGFAFGLSCLALFIGSLPSYTSLKYWLSGNIPVFVTILVSVIALYIGLKKYFTKE